MPISFHRNVLSESLDRNVLSESFEQVPFLNLVDGPGFDWAGICLYVLGIELGWLGGLSGEAGLLGAGWAGGLAGLPGLAGLAGLAGLVRSLAGWLAGLLAQCVGKQGRNPATPMRVRH